MRWYGPNNAYLVVAGDVDTRRSEVQLAQNILVLFQEGADKKVKITKSKFTTE